MISELALQLGVSTQTLADQIKRGRIKARKVKTPNAAGFYYDVPSAEVERLRRRRGK